MPRLVLAGCCVVLFAPCVLTAQESPSVPSSDLGELHCSATATAPIVRIEGTSEMIGDVLITCHNAGPASRPEPRGYIDADISLSLNVGLGNRTDFGRGSDVTDAVLVVNENNCAAASRVRTFDGCGSENQTVQGPMLGRLGPMETGTLLWSRVAVPVPGAAIAGSGTSTNRVADCTGRFGVPGGCHPTTTTIRLTNIRANASQLGASGRATGIVVPVQASLSIRAAGARVRLSGSQFRVAEAATGLSAEARLVDSDRLCSHGESFAEVALSEGFASSFKAAGTASYRPGQPGWQESFYPLGTDDAGPSYVPSGTRLRIALAGVPSGVSVFVPPSVSCASDGGGTSRLAFVEGALPSGLGGTLAPAQSADRPVRVSDASEAQAVYEVRNTDPLGQEACSVPFRFSRPITSTGLFEGGAVSISASLAPFGSDESEGPRNNQFRFARVRVSAGPRLRMASCGTTLFFPFVTNRSNFDTAIVIANTSADPLGTRHQSGQCILRYHGSGVEGQVEPSIQRSAVIEAGKHLAFTLSGGRPALGLVPLTDFQGTLVAECGFQHGHGFAFVTEQVNGTAILAQGYLAEVLEDTAERESGDDSP